MNKVFGPIVLDKPPKKTEKWEKEFDETKALFQKALEIDSGHKKARARLKELEEYQGKR